jgi:hypothetical protein
VLCNVPLLWSETRCLSVRRERGVGYGTPPPNGMDGGGAELKNVFEPCLSVW